jgi:energy-coupling factor transporter ATP-binding protein EcfA2
VPDDLLAEYVPRAAMPAHPPASTKLQLVFFLWRQASIQGLRRDDEFVYTRVWASGTPTSAWKPLKRDGKNMTIEKWALHETQPQTRWDQWWLREHTSVEFVASTLRNTETSMWPLFKPDRSLVAWRNGVVQNSWRNPESNTVEARWLAHEAPELVDMCACVYHDAYMDPQFWDTGAYAAAMDIPTDAFDTVPNTQHFDEESRWFLYGMLGRLLCPFKVADKEEQTLLIVGCAGSGKSTLVDVMKDMYPKERVRVVAINAKDDWVAGFLDGAWLWVMPEMKGEMTMNQATLQSLTTGEDVQAEKKNLHPYNTNIEANGIIAGNELATNLQDAGGSLTRRFAYITMDYKPTTQDGTLKERVKGEKAAIYAKTVRCYYELIGRMQAYKLEKQVQSADITDIMPLQIKRMQSRLLMNLQPGAHMLVSPKMFTPAPKDARAFWFTAVDPKLGTILPTAPRNGVRLETHPAFYDGQGALQAHRLPLNPLDYVSLSGEVTHFDEYRVEEDQLRKVWDMYCDENNMPPAKRAFKVFDMRSSACNFKMVVVNYNYVPGRTSKRSRGPGGGDVGGAASGGDASAAASSRAEDDISVETFCIYGLKLLEHRRALVATALGADSEF